MFYHEPLIKSYFTALKQEIKNFYENEVVKTIYIGGGTPSMLKVNELNELFEIIKILKKDSDIEFSFECNPEDINHGLLETLKKNGVNRLSIGIQSFNEEKLNFMERKTNYEELEEKIKLIRNFGFNNINLDLIYGIPGETFNDLKKDIKDLLKLKPEHISTYALIIEENTKIKIDGYENVSEELEVKMYEYICKKLSRKGLKQYEVSNFALKNHQSRHNLAYWHNHEYYGFGLGAAGYMNGFRYENTRNINNYLKGKYRYHETLLSKTEIMEHELMLGFRKTKGVNIQEFEDKYEVTLEETFPIKPLLKNKDLILKNGHIFINPKKIYMMNEILLKMI